MDAARHWWSHKSGLWRSTDTQEADILANPTLNFCKSKYYLRHLLLQEINDGKLFPQGRKFLNE